MKNLLNAEKVKRSAERQIEAALEAAQREIEHLKVAVWQDLSQLERLIGREAIKDWLKTFPDLPL